MKLLLLVLLSPACTRADAPLRPYVSLAPAPTRDLPFQTEHELWELVRVTLDGAGLPYTARARLVLDERVPLPLTFEDEVHCRHFLNGDEALLDGVGQLGLLIWGEPLVLQGWTAQDLREASLAWYTASLGHELGHAASFHAGSVGRDDPWVEETRARDLEWPLLHRLVELGRIPPTWPELYRRLLISVEASYPDWARDALPSDPEQQAELLRHGLTLNTPGDPGFVTASLVALRYSLARAEQPPGPLNPAEAFAPDPEATLKRVLAAGAWEELNELGVVMGPAYGEGVLFSAEQERWTGAALTDEAAQDLRMRWDLDVSGLQAHRVGVLELLNFANTQLIGPGVYLQGETLIYYGPRQPVPDEASAAMALMEAWTEAQRWLDPIAAYAEGRMTELEAQQAMISGESGASP